jgi:glycerophosphoryl diester phosphodiesterase
VRLTALEDALTAFPDHVMSIEIKQSVPSLANPLCDVLRRTGASKRVYLSANEDSDVYAAQAACPESVVITTTYRDLAEMRAARQDDQPFCWPAPISQPPYREGRFTATDIAWTHEHGGAVYTWTVDDPTVLRELAVAGVDGVYTRRPDVARAVFDSLD